MKDFHNLDLHNKRVLLRMDLNVPVTDNKITDYSRITRIKATIDILKQKNAKIILISHFGRPEGKKDLTYSLRFLASELAEIYQTKVHFIDELQNLSAIEETHKLPAGEIILFENLRFYPQEELNGEQFSAALANLGDIYINEAFSCSHRQHASIVGIPKFLPSYPGLLLLEEINSLEKVIAKDSKPITAIVGGKKVSTKFKVLEFLDSNADFLVIAGAMANTFLKAQGYNIGSSFYEENLVHDAQHFLKKAKSKIILPSDVVVANKTSDGNFINPIMKNIQDLKDDSCILDLCMNSIKEITLAIDSSKTLLWNGPLGYFEDARFRDGSDEVAQVVATYTKASKLQSIAGGGDTLALLESNGLIKEFSYVSTAGGAFLEWLENGDLPGIAALRN